MDIRNPELWVPLVGRPMAVECPMRIKFIECGAYHTMAISVDNKVFGCGLNHKGQLGISLPDSKESQSSLHIKMQGPFTSSISAKKLLSKEEWTDFKINQEEYANTLYPTFTEVPVLCGFGFCQLACGEDFTLLLTNNGNVLSTGNGALG